MKAILEIDMPESCAECNFCMRYDLNTMPYCSVTGDDIATSRLSERAEFCPLKPYGENNG